MKALIYDNETRESIAEVITNRAMTDEEVLKSVGTLHPDGDYLLDDVAHIYHFDELTIVWE